MNGRAERSDKEVRLNWRAILGLNEPALPGSSRLRAAQVSRLAGMFPITCVSQLLSGLALVSILWGSVPPSQLGLWFAAILAVMASSARWKMNVGAAATDNSRLGLIRNISYRAVALGCVWAVPSILFAPNLPLEQQLAICLFSAAMIATAALIAPAVPLVMLIFMGLVGAGLTIMMASVGSPLLALLPAVYTACFALGGLSLSHTYIRRQLAEVSLAEKNEVVSLLLREFEAGGADWLWQIDAAKRLHHVSPGLARAAGTDAAALEGTPLLRLLAGDHWEQGELLPELSKLFEQLNQRQSFSDLHLPVMIRGERRWWCLSAAPRRDDRGNFIGFRGVGSDVTVQRRSADAIDRLARFDSLTGLANRQTLTDGLRKALTRTQRGRVHCALLLIDLDRFKPVNDTLGHPVGDKLLKQVAERLRALIGDKDVAGRLGGDEFAIVLRDVAHVGLVMELGEAVVAALTRPFEIDGHSIRIGGSVGAAISPKDGRSVEALMRCADLALYRAKEDGRGVFRRYEPGMLARAEKRLATENALREAIDKGQFHLVFQPIIDVARAGVEGFEALLRWDHPKLGSIPPAEFLPIAEEARLSTRIGEWVLRTACMEAASWPEPVRVAVNLSSEQLHDPQLPAIIVSALSHTGLDPSRLELELSEALFLRDRGPVLSVLDRLRDLGVRIALDDFGIGYASLGYLAQGRFSTIKIDSRFVTGAAADDPECLAIVRGIVAMTQSLGISTTAEGTETAEQHARLRELGCSQVQGHQIGGPMSAERARALVSDDRRRAVG